ncbi:glycosyltransferase family 2 protein [Larkinella humicola]|uniref:Glycosyltransferase family 2 protein n=1 Tax=Larkinella humicola TaxID=2607654 RepID=A0A5N1J5N2_9BACT|nr:glycosyltransferase family 2 protein [Larkinella humicola]KAA9340389.1 glycosyltransferase family 2 protein [Larkinella humicola]
MQPYLSVVICVYNEEGNIFPMIDQVERALIGYDFEIVYVNDGSSDRTLAELKAVHNDRLVVVDLQTNYGQSLALAAGIDVARGQYIITMDGDLQNDPADIPMMVRLAEEGDYDLVAGIRANRQDGALLRKLPSRIANWIIRQTSGVHLKDYGCALKVFRSDLAKNLGLYGELHRFIPVLARLEGARMTQTDVQHHPRRIGQSKYGLGRTLKVVSDLILMLFMKKYLRKPMHLFGNWGLISLMVGLLINGYLLILKLMGNDIWGRPLLILGTILVLAGIQLITFGIMTELQMRTYYESQDKKPYKIRRIYKTALV